MTAPDDPAARLAGLLAHEAARWAEGGLGALRTEGGPRPSAELAARWAESDPAWAAAQAETWARRLLEWLHARNQFLVASLAEVTCAVGGAIDRAAREGLAAGLDALRAELAALVRGQLGEAPVEVVCSEYSPALQLRLLGLTLEAVRGPALDVGCGASAALVTLLRAQGLAAEGIDRARGDDWLDPRHYPPGRFATVLSHQAFSLHFLHHHLRAGPTAMAYAETYMTILRALPPGGLLAYAPGLPFIEGMLPRRQFTVERVALPAGCAWPRAG